MDMQLDDILAKLDPKTRARVQSAVDIQIEKQPTPSIGLNFALNGGFAHHLKETHHQQRVPYHADQ